MTRIVTSLFLISFLLALASSAHAQKTYTWTLVESPGAALLWPNQAGSPNIAEANWGLLGRVLTDTGDVPVTNPNVQNSCELAPSYPCAANQPPAFLLYPGLAEGPSGAGGGIECNRKVTGFNTLPIPGVGHGGHPVPEDGIGEYSYLVAHTVSVYTSTPVQKFIGFISGEYTLVQDPYTCNQCPPDGAGKDIPDQMGLTNSTPTAPIEFSDVSLWTTQWVWPLGHWSIGLANYPFEYPKEGATSACGSGKLFQTLGWGIGLGPNVVLTQDQKLLFRTYSVDTSQHSTDGISGACDPMDCYVEKVIIPAALQQSEGNAKSVQVLSGSQLALGNGLPALDHAVIDMMVFAYTTDLIDMDGDGTEDRVDPCPNDPTDFCRNDLIGGGFCPAGQVFCLDAGGAMASCKEGALCETRMDVDQSCTIRGQDLNLVRSSIAFNSLPIGPFDP